MQLIPPVFLGLHHVVDISATDGADWVDDVVQTTLDPTLSLLSDGQYSWLTIY